MRGYTRCTHPRSYTLFAELTSVKCKFPLYIDAVVICDEMSDRNIEIILFTSSFYFNYCEAIIMKNAAM